MIYKIAVGTKKFEVDIGEVRDGFARVTVNNNAYDVNIENFAEVSAGTELRYKSKTPAAAQTFAPRPVSAALPKTAAPAAFAAAGGNVVVAPIPGLILDIKVSVGDTVGSGQVVAVMEAMKMENNLISHASGKVLEIRVQKGAQVSTGDVVMVIGS